MFYRPEPLKSNRQKLSNLLLFCFFTAIVMAGAFSEFFQTPRKTDDDLMPWQQLFTPQQLARIQELELTNKLGTFRFKKQKKSNNKERWYMVHPRNLSADRDTIDKIFAGIQQIKVLKIYPQDPINLSHYSLDKPAGILKFSDADKKTIILKTGLVNPIDNSTYMTLSDKKPLFHIENLNFPLETLKLSNFIDSTVFSLSLSEITKIQIYRRSSGLSFSAKLQDGRWLNRRNKAFKQDAIEPFLEKIFSLRSLLILDETTKQLEKEIRKYSARPLYTIKIQDQENKTHTYKISYPLNKLIDIKIEKGQNSLITSSDGTYPRLIDKEHLTIFNRSEKQLY